MAEHEVLLPLVDVLLPVIITALGIGGFWALIVRKIGKVRTFFDILDDAVQDDIITPQERQEIINSFLDIFKDKPQSIKNAAEKALFSPTK